MSSAKYRALVCCRAGMGSSAMLKIKCDQVINEEGYSIATEAGNLDAIQDFDGNLVITMSDLAEELLADAKIAHVAGIRNIVDKKEIKEQLEAFLEAVEA
nr:PTS sugar transporter subunit IIB [uncultured Olsenella sp.]